MNQKFEECSKSEVDFNRNPVIQTALENSVWDKIEAKYALTNSTIEFEITRSNDRYIDLSEIQLFLQVKFKDVGNNNISVSNNILHTLISNVEVKINNTTVSNTSSKYHYKAYIENLLGFNKESKDTFLKCEGWYDDNDFDVLKLTSKDNAPINKGYVSRNELIKSDRIVELSGMLHIDISSVDRLLMNNNNVLISLKKNENKVILLGDATDISKVSIEYSQAFILVRRVTVSPSLMLSNTMLLEKQPATYPFKRVRVIEISGTFNSTICTFTDITSGVMPTRVIVGFVETKAFTGDYNLNPYNFKNFNISSAILKVNSTNVPYSSDLEFNFEKKNYHQAYNTLLKGIKYVSNGISYSNYPDGNMLMAFNLSPDLCNEHLSLNKDGKLHMTIKLKEGSSTAITGIFYLEFDNSFQINKSGAVALDYTP